MYSMCYTDTSTVSIAVAMDNSGAVYIDGKLIKYISQPYQPVNITVRLPVRVIAVVVKPNNIRLANFVVESYPQGFVTSDLSWKCTTTSEPNTDWLQKGFDDSSWQSGLIILSNENIRTNMVSSMRVMSGAVNWVSMLVLPWQYELSCRKSL
jgi:hypothetical protein